MKVVNPWDMTGCARKAEAAEKMAMGTTPIEVLETKRIETCRSMEKLLPSVHPAQHWRNDQAAIFVTRTRERHISLRRLEAPAQKEAGNF